MIHGEVVRYYCTDLTSDKSSQDALADATIGLVAALGQIKLQFSSGLQAYRVTEEPSCEVFSTRILSSVLLDVSKFSVLSVPRSPQHTFFYWGSNGVFFLQRSYAPSRKTYSMTGVSEQRLWAAGQ